MEAIRTVPDTDIDLLRDTDPLADMNPPVLGYWSSRAISTPSSRTYAIAIKSTLQNPSAVDEAVLKGCRSTRKAAMVNIARDLLEPRRVVSTAS